MNRIAAFLVSPGICEEEDSQEGIPRSDTRQGQERNSEAARVNVSARGSSEPSRLTKGAGLGKA